MDLILFFILGLLSSFVGGLPFGLVNLSILNVSVTKGSREAFNIAFGASCIEILFAWAAFYIGEIILNFILAYPFIKTSIIAVLLIAAIFFLRKKNSINIKKQTTLKIHGFFRGILLMSVSFQVVLMWIAIIAYMKSNALVNTQLITLTLFLPGVFLGKMIAYYLYDKLSHYIQNNFQRIAQNINRIVGYLLLLIATIYIIKLIINLG